MSLNANARGWGFDARIAIVGMFLLADTAVQIAFKIAGDRLGSGSLDVSWLATAASTPVMWLAIVLYFAVFVLWMLILQDMDLSRAFPLTALTYVTVPAAGILFFHETLDWQRSTGIALILIGVLLVGNDEASGKEE